MYHVIFQVQPSASGYQTYLDTAARLRPQLETINGFISVERFRSLKHDRGILSLSKWADEASLVRWRTMRDHHDAQKSGRDGVFENYRLRVGQVASRAQSRRADWAPDRRTPYRSAQGPARFVSVLEVSGFDRSVLDPSATNAVDTEWYENMGSPGKCAWVIGWDDESAARAWHDQARLMLNAAHDVTFELSLVELERDYGLFEREEAPQFYPPVSPRNRT